MSVWRWVVDGPLPSARNMARDEALLRLVRRPVLRLYRWCPATVSIGAHQDPRKALDADWCRSQGIGWVRRPTGGRAVLHETSEWTYAVVAPLEGTEAGPFRGLALLTCYQVIAEALATGLRRMGIDVEVVRGAAREDPSLRDAPCYLSAARYEILLRGRKLVGSAQRRLPGSFLQHGSIPLLADAGRLALATGRKELPGDCLAAIEPALGRPPGEGEIPDAIRRGFEQWFGVTLEEGGLTEEESRVAQRLEERKYATDAWNLRREAG